MYSYAYQNDYYYPDHLCHYGIKGMKWGVRRARGHAGPGKYMTRNRQLAGDKRDLKYLNNGGHLSVGLTKKRQAAYDRRDKAALEKRISKNEALVNSKIERDKFKARRQTVGASRTLGAKVATNLWAGPFANRTYNSVIASGGSKVAALGVTTATGLLGGPVGHLVVSALYANNSGEVNYRRK